MMVVLSIIIGLLILSFMVIIHELGHFTAAKLLGFRVLAFSVGFGKVLLKKTAGETEYRISAIPFGGYVKMAGEQPEEERTGEEHEFTAKPKWQRAVVAVAGPLANYLSAILMLWVMYLYGVPHEKFLDHTNVGYVADSSAAQAAGIRSGDSITAINGKPVHSWNDIFEEFSIPTKKIPVSLVRGNNPVEVNIFVASAQNEAFSKPPYGMLPSLPAVVGAVSPGFPAAQAGIVAGDTILAIDTIPIHSWVEMSYIIQRTTSAERSVVIKRNSSEVTLSIAPRYDATAKRYLLGISSPKPETYTVHYPPKAAFSRSLDKAWDYTTMIFDVFGKLFSRQVSPTELSGPVGIIPASGAIALQGLSPILNFMALISVNLAVLNLLPLIITDGGLLLFLLIEAIRRKPLAVETQIRINQVAITLFIALFLYITFNDIHRLPEIFRMFGK